MEKANFKIRAWEIDFLRGIALICMIIFHIVFDLRDLYNIPIDYAKGFFYYEGKFSAILFMLISGISSSFSRNNFKRGLKIFSIAMFITLATYIFDPRLIIKFGILHYFGISMMLYGIFKDLNKYLLLITGTVIIVIGNIFSNMTVVSPYLFPIGLISSSFFSSDYYPIFPWFGIFLYGIAIGKFLYKEKRSIFNFTIPDNPINFLGRHSLIVYLLHQPVILFILNVVMKK
ncbi:acyltransferase family protein [Oxobacter pfennigii]|uniref:Acyltransferase family protein n=1 Tax=Oxobacter pfennigii TaxID=36849 RepID=A0A0P9AKW1_9CLOT|nr:heparan-alpha-glucosaminide N-acetyltransferase [Oxobacter pfennigii]KPU45966.1 acyltransferase family protein [Oxobacter pfennigii]